MREIEFRGWNGQAMIGYSHWFTLDEQKTLCFEDTDDHRYVDNSDVDYPERVILMQYTGLKDKNGKKVFEGDIVLSSNIVKPYVIEWTSFEDGEDGYGMGVGLNFHPEDSKSSKVIGNIYENKELLNETRNN